MADQWTLLRTYADVTDAEQEAVRLISADVPAVVTEPVVGRYEVRVLAGREADAADVLDVPSPTETAAATQAFADQLRRATADTVRERQSDRTAAFAVYGFAFPPLAVYAVWLACRAVRQPGPSDMSARASAWWSLGIGLLSLAFWAVVVLAVTSEKEPRSRPLPPRPVDFAWPTPDDRIRISTFPTQR